MLDLTKPPRAVEGLVPNGGSDRYRSGEETGSVDISSDEPVRTWKVAFAVGAGEFARGSVNAQRLILPSIGLVVVWTIRPIDKNEVSEGLEIQLSFPCGTEDAVPVCLV